MAQVRSPSYSPPGAPGYSPPGDVLDRVLLLLIANLFCLLELTFRRGTNLPVVKSNNNLVTFKSIQPWNLPAGCLWVDLFDGLLL